MDIKNVLFWIFLVFSMFLFVWHVFGDSPTEFVALAALIFTVLLKVSSVGERLAKLEMKFEYLAKDFKEHVKHR